jgi:hypothetical protein
MTAGLLPVCTENLIHSAKFDATRCAKGLEALREYKSEWDEDARTFKRTPNHDWASHAADAWGYLSVGWNYAPKPQEQKPKGPPTDERGVWMLTVEDLLDIHGRGDIRIRV